MKRKSRGCHGGRAWSLTLVLALALSLLAVAPGQAQEDLIPVDTGIVAAIDQLGTPVALERGYFEKYGLDVVIANPYATGVDQLNALQAGEIQIAQVGVPMIGAVLRGMDLVILGSYSGSASQRGSDLTMAVVARPGSGIEKPEDLKGKRIAVSFGTINHLYLLALLDKAGLSVDDVVMVNTPPPDMPIALQTGGVDAMVSWDPWPIIALFDVEGSYEVIRGGGIISYIGYIVAMRDWVEQNPDTVERFLAARAEADQWMRANPEGVAEVAVRWLSGMRPDVALVASKYNSEQLDIRKSAYNYEALHNAQQLLYDLGFTAGTFDVNKVFMPQYIHNVMAKYPELFSDLEPIPADAQWTPDYVFKP